MRATVVFSSPTVTIVDVVCRPGAQARSEVEVEPSFGISFPRRGVYVHQTPRGRVVADSTVAIFRNQGDEHTTTHPTVEGDANTEIQFPSHVVEPLLDGNGRFGRKSVPVPDTLTIRHHRLLSLARSCPSEPLAIEEEALSILRRALSFSRPHEGSDRWRSLIADTREQLATSYRDNFDLATIAGRVGSSPFHLSRLFKETTGLSVTEHRTVLRIRHVVDRLASGCDDLARVAVEAGFYDHAHMTKAFRRRIGSVPSAMRSMLTG